MPQTPPHHHTTTQNYPGHSIFSPDIIFFREKIKLLLYNAGLRQIYAPAQFNLYKRVKPSIQIVGNKPTGHAVDHELHQASRHNIPLARNGKSINNSLRGTAQGNKGNISPLPVPRPFSYNPHAASPFPDLAATTPTHGSRNGSTRRSHASANISAVKPQTTRHKIWLYLTLPHHHLSGKP